MAYELYGPWEKGYAFDLHTLASIYLGVDAYGHDRWDSRRSEMGELLYLLKYKGQTQAVGKIVDLLLTRFKGIDQRDYIIPIPASNQRRLVQPVLEIAKELGKHTGVPVAENLLVKRAGVELKNVDHIAEREQLLRQSLQIVSPHDLAGKNVLLVDDLYRSGATLSAATQLLYDHGVRGVVALTMTKTRSKT